MVLSFNPVNITHWIKRHFIDSGLATVCFSTYKDNKFLSEDDRKTLEDFKETDEYYYEVYCLGQWGTLGKSYFDSNKINERMLKLPIPIRTGYFEYSQEGNLIEDIEFIDDPEGYIKIYEDVKQGYPYVIGGDTAGTGIDYFIGQVIDNTTGRQVAVLRHQTDEDEYARQMYCLGLYYNEALIGIENNYSTYPTKKLVEYGYYNLFIRELEDKIAETLEERYGFMTTKTTRPIILSILKEVIREDVDLLNDRTTLEECLTFVRNKKGRPEAQNGAHDDTVMALAIAYYIREQQGYQVVKNEIKTTYELPFELRDEEGETNGMLVNW